MRIPVWLTLAVAAVVILFGAYRIKLGLMRTEEQEAAAKKRGGLYAMSKRTHLAVGIVYLLLAGGLIAVSFGWNPWGGSDEAAATKPKPKS